MKNLKQEINSKIQTDGYYIGENILKLEFISRAKQELMDAIEKEANFHGERGFKDYAMVLLCSLYGGTFLELFENEKLLLPFNSVLGDGCIVYAYTSSSMPPNESNYSNRIHVDCPRIIPGYVTNMGATILLDDFNEENGATWFLPGSHTRADQPN